MASVGETIIDFINAERDRYAGDDNNRFAFAFAQISRYYRFLQIIMQRHVALNEQFIDNTRETQDRLRRLGEGTHPLTAEDVRLLEEGQCLGMALQLETESFYVFAKMLLDRVAHAFEFYFGPARGLSFDSHDNLTKSLNRYAQVKGLALPDELVPFTHKLKQDISDFRDYQIAHEKSPRTIRSMMFDASGKTKMALGKLYPREGDTQQETRLLDELLEDIEMYLSLLMRLIETNRAKTRLRIVAAETAE